MRKDRILLLDQACACRVALAALLQLLLSSQMRKPLIERKRRERINNCLDQLKEAVIGAFQLDVSTSTLPRVPPPTGNLLYIGTRLSTAVQAGEGRHPGDDSQASAEHPEQQARW